jgi:hypothetical protein
MSSPLLLQQKIQQDIKIVDNSVIPNVFYNDVINRNKENLINIIKLNPNLSLNIIKFYNNVLGLSYKYISNCKNSSSYKVPWKNNLNENVVLSVPKQYFLYEYCVQSILPNGNILSNFAYLVYIINSYLVQLRAAMKMINNKEFAGHYFPLSINAKNNIEMKIFIAKFITNNNLI